MPLPPQFAAKIKQHLDAGHSPREAFGKALSGAGKKCPECGKPLVAGKCPEHGEPDADDAGGKGDNDGDEG